MITILKPKGIDHIAELKKRDPNYVPDYTTYYGIYEPKGHLTVELSTDENTFYQSWLEPTYNRMYVSEILSFTKYLLIHVYDIIGHCTR